MTNLTESWLWIGFIGMAVGSAIFGFKAVTIRRREGMEFSLVSCFITLWAAIIYLTMILGETVLTNFNGQSEIFIGRYIDWIVTTPLLLLDLGVLAAARPNLIGGVIGADLIMIITGGIAALEKAPNKYLWYIISCGAFLAVLIALLTEFSATARQRDIKVSKLFHKLRNVLVGLWFIYPIVWILGPEGVGTISVGVETIAYTILDLSAKVGFGLILTSASQNVLAQASNHSEIGAVDRAYIEE